MYTYQRDMKLVEFMNYLTEAAGMPDYAYVIRSKVTGFLQKEGYIVREEKRTKPTKKGQELGISETEGVSEKGESYVTLLYGRAAQELIAEKLPEFKEEVDREHGGTYKKGMRRIGENGGQASSGDALRARGLFYGREISFKRVYAAHIFSDEEVQRLLNGEILSFQRENGEGDILGRLQRLQGEHGFYFRFVGDYETGFKEEYGPGDLVDPRQIEATGRFFGKEISFRASYKEHIFSEEEINRLLKGEIISFTSEGTPGPIRGRLQQEKDRFGQPFYVFVPETSGAFKEN